MYQQPSSLKPTNRARHCKTSIMRPHQCLRKIKWKDYIQFHERADQTTIKTIEANKARHHQISRDWTWKNEEERKQSKHTELNKLHNPWSIWMTSIDMKSRSCLVEGGTPTNIQQRRSRIKMPMKQNRLQWKNIEHVLAKRTGGNSAHQKTKTWEERMLIFHSKDILLP